MFSFKSKNKTRQENERISEVTNKRLDNINKLFTIDSKLDAILNNRRHNAIYELDAPSQPIRPLPALRDHDQPIARPILQRPRQEQEVETEARVAQSQPLTANNAIVIFSVEVWSTYCLLTWPGKPTGASLRFRRYTSEIFFFFSCIGRGLGEHNMRVKSIPRHKIGGMNRLTCM